MTPAEPQAGTQASKREQSLRIEMVQTLTKRQARRFYDWLGRKLDSQAFYEQSGLDELCAHGGFVQAQAVFEFGCGTGRLAEDLFRRFLGPQTRYRAVDISPTMVDISRERLQPWADRVSIEVTDGSPLLHLPDGLLCRVCITPGTTPLSRLVMRLWKWLGRLHPLLIGGCRPISLRALLAPGEWSIEHHHLLTRWGLAIKVLVAGKRQQTL